MPCAIRVNIYLCVVVVLACYARLIWFTRLIQIRIRYSDDATDAAAVAVACWRLIARRSAQSIVGLHSAHTEFRIWWIVFLLLLCKYIYTWYSHHMSRESSISTHASDFDSTISNEKKEEGAREIANTRWSRWIIIWNVARICRTNLNVPLSIWKSS